MFFANNPKPNRKPDPQPSPGRNLAADRRGWMAAWVVLVLSGCATVPSWVQTADRAPLTPPPPYYLRAELDDPFSVIERATQRLSATRKTPPSTEPDDLWSRAIDRFEFAQCQDFPQAEAWASWFAERPEYIERVMGRAQPWLYDIVSELERRELPGELALLPVVESAYDPFAYSHGRAAGTWQFVSATALGHGIQINDHYDGRRDVYVATRAALGYLDQLSTRFDGDWNLALAAYNGGQGRVARAIARNRRANRATDWRSLSLPRETKAYIPKLHGLACLFENAQRHGLTLPRWPVEPLVERIELPGPTDVVLFASQIGLSMDELLALNPGLNQHITSPTGPHHLIVPIELAERAREVLRTTPHTAFVRYQSVLVSPGDTLSTLAARHNTTAQALKTHNGLDSDLIRVGQRLEIPTAISADKAKDYSDRYQELALLQSRLVPAKRIEHRVRPGESLWVIARRYRVSIDELKRWNNLGQAHLIKPGQRLSVVLESASRPGQAVASPPTRYVVQTGDSLWAIARRHRIPLVDLIEHNDLSPESVLRPGQTLRLQAASQGAD